MLKLYVGNLPYSFKDEDLKNTFSPFGTVVSASIIMERDTNRSKGFGFVEMEDDEAANKAIKELNGKDLGGRNIVVSIARPKEERPNRGFGGGRDRFNRN